MREGEDEHFHRVIISFLVPVVTSSGRGNREKGGGSRSSRGRELAAWQTKGAYIFEEPRLYLSLSNYDSYSISSSL